MNSPTILDDRPFGSHWWSQCLRVRYHSVAALKAGLVVKVELRIATGFYSKGIPEPMITWTGTKEQFVATDLFPATVLDRITRGRRYWISGLTGQVNRLSVDRFEFTIEGGSVSSKIHVTRHLQLAHADEHFLSFRDKVMAGFPLKGLGCES